MSTLHHHASLPAPPPRHPSLVDRLKAMDDAASDSLSATSLLALENETDEFGRILLQHRRDEKRLQALRASDRAFTRAGPIQLLAATRERPAAAPPPKPQPLEPPPGKENLPLNVPRDWGRRARRPRDWARKTQEVHIHDDGGDTWPEKDQPDRILRTQRPHPATESPNPPPVRSIETTTTTPPPRRKSRLLLTPSSMRHMNTTLISPSPAPNTTTPRPPPDPDFTGFSLRASTPAVLRSPRRIDELTRRELAHAAAATTSALPPRPLRAHPLADPLPHIPPPAPAPRYPPSPDKPASPSRLPRRPRRTVDVGDAPRRAAVTAPRPATLATPPPAAPTPPSRHPRAPTPDDPRPGTQRADPLSLLRKLARVSSASPPRADAEAATADAQPDRPVADAKPAGKEAAVAPAPSEASRAAFAAAQQSRRTRAERRTAPPSLRVRSPSPLARAHGPATPVLAAGVWRDTMVKLDDDDDDVVPAHAQKTHTRPRAAPNADARHPPPASRASDAKAPSRPETNPPPPPPQSALEAIVAEAKASSGAAPYGDSTMQSLEDIAHPNLDCTDDLAVALDLDAMHAAASPPDPEPARPRAPRRRQSPGRSLKGSAPDALAIEALRKHLLSARTNLVDVDRGLRRVENRIDKVEGEPPAVDGPTAKAAAAAAGGAPVVVHTHCTCGARPPSLFRALGAEFLAFFYAWDPTYRFRLRLTWLGLALLVWTVWYVAENWLCELYCHPLYAEWVADWPDPNAPEYPFVLPTLLLRPWRWLWEPLCPSAVLEGARVAWTAVFGDDFSGARREVNRPPQYAAHHPVLSRRGGGYDGARRWAASLTETSARVAQSVVDAVDEVGSMWDDELVL